jgi:RNA polymerase sigma-70 factor (ECF subfamily)
VSDAEDIVQETYLRWASIEHGSIKEPRAYLSRVAARLCLDHLKSARVQRERYVGPWLPEPIVHAAGFSTSPIEDRADEVSIALMLALERLSPLERAAFVLHDVFGQSFEEISLTLERSPAACRQLATRARAQLRGTRPRFAVPAEHGERIVEAFQRAARTGDLARLTELLASDAVMHTDSGGKVIAARRLIVGGDRIARFFAILTPKKAPPRAVAPVRINGLPGLLRQDASGLTETLAFEVRGDRITAIYYVRNPDKLRHVRLPPR